MCQVRVMIKQKFNKRGVAIRMSWHAFFEKINNRGGDVYSEPKSTYFGE